MKAVIKALLNSYWAIEPQFAKSYSQVVQDIMAHKNIELLKEKETGGKAQFLGSAGFLFDSEIKEEEEKEGDINVIPVKGVIVKYDTLCEMGTSTMSSLIQKGDSDDKVKFHLLDIDTGGGMCDGTEHFANTISNASKPVIAFINGMCASAGYWIASQCDSIIANDNTTMVGSIGTMVSYRDFSEAMQKAGVKDVSIYADASTEKNKESEALVNGDDAPMRDLLNRLNNQFLTAVKKGRKNIDQEQTLSGKIFIGSECLDVGLIDKIDTIEGAINLGFSLSNNNNMFNSEERKKEFLSEFGKFFGLTPKSEITTKEEQMAIDHNQEKMDSLQSEIEGKELEITQLKTELEEVKAGKEQAETDNVEAVGLLDSYKSKLSEATGIIAEFKQREQTPASTEDITRAQAQVEEKKVVNSINVMK